MIAMPGLRLRTRQQFSIAGEGNKLQAGCCAYLALKTRKSLDRCRHMHRIRKLQQHRENREPCEKLSS